MAESSLRCWTRSANDGHSYIHCEDGEKSKKGKSKRTSAEKEFARLVAKERRKQRFMREMTSAEKELAELLAKDDLDALLMLDRFATPIDREPRSSYAPANATNIDKEVIEVKRKPYKLKPYHKKAGWIVQYSKRFPDAPYYFNTKTGETRWFPPEERSISLEARMAMAVSQMINEQRD